MTKVYANQFSMEVVDRIPLGTIPRSVSETSGDFEFNGRNLVINYGQFGFAIHAYVKD